jgi:hypothetical protein
MSKARKKSQNVAAKLIVDTGLIVIVAQYDKATGKTDFAIDGHGSQGDVSFAMAAIGECGLQVMALLGLGKPPEAAVQEPVQ